MGRHAADDGAARDPLVADALDRRPEDAEHGVHEESRLPGREGPIGWPGAEPDEGDDPDQGGTGREPIGWPGA